MKIMPIHSQELIDRDELYKLTSTSSGKNKKNLQTVVTQYRYTCDSEIGHCIKGSLPKLIKIPKSSDYCEQIALTAFLLLEIIKIKSKRITIIHFDKTDSLWLQPLFKVTNVFPGVKVTYDVGEFLRSSDNMVLVTNYNCVKGLEFSEVLLILDADENHLKQFIPEAMARCMSNLAILVRTKPKGYPKSETVAGLVHHWEKYNYNIRESILTVLKLKFCSNRCSINNENGKKTHCQKNASRYTSYKIHKRCEWYRGLSAKFQDSFVPKIQLKLKTIPKEAEDM